MRIPVLLFACLFGAGTAGTLNAIDEPSPITHIDVEVFPPYSRTGLLLITGDSGAVGSAFLIGPKTLATAAHVIYDDANHAWEPPANTEFYRGYSDEIKFYMGDHHVPTAWYKWDSYSNRAQNDTGEEGTSSYDTFNLDLAVGFYSDESDYVSHEEPYIITTGDISILRDPRDKMIVGYPSDDDAIPLNEQGLMHRAGPADYKTFWYPLTKDPSTWRDSENFWFSLYDMQGVNSYSGNSGGPIFVRDDDNRWVGAAVLVGGGGGGFILVRGFDDEAMELIEAVQAAQPLNKLRRPTNLTASNVTATSVELSWTDRSDETDYRIFRRSSGPWEVIETVPADTVQYVDSVEPGSVYFYRVQPFDNFLRGIRSEAIKVETPGPATNLARAAGARYLYLQSRGDSSFLADGNSLKSGLTRSMGESILELRVTGPGTLSFDWSVSSEDNPGATILDDAYDTFSIDASFAVNGNWISGIVPNARKSLSVPAGPQTIRWRYAKDPYTQAGEDAGRLANLDWQPAPGSPMIHGALDFGDNWRGSAWLGNYHAESLPWIYHIEFGWMWLIDSPGNGTNAIAYNLPMRAIYLDPDVFPYIYDYSNSRWVYYYTGSGSAGKGAWFFDLNTNSFFQAD